MKNYLLLLAAISLIGISSTLAQTQHGSTAISNGHSSATSATYQTQSIVGQVAIGALSATNYQTTAGFLPTTQSVALVDVSIDNVNLNPATVGLGADVSFTFNIQSTENGGIQANTLEVSIYLSTDLVIDAGELLKTVTVANAIPGNSTYTFPQTGDDEKVTIPVGTTPGDYNLIFELDPSNAVGETNETNNESASALTVSDDTIDPVIGTISKSTYFSTGSTVSVSVNDNVGVTMVNFYHRGIRTSDTDGWGTALEASLVSGLYTITLDATWLDELGVEYWFEAFDEVGNGDSSSVNYTYSQTPGDELSLPSIQAGTNQSNYQMISIPFDLTQKNATSVFSKLGVYDVTKWRMYHYVNGNTKEYNQGWSSIEPGKSYWIIHNVPDAGEIFIGEGTAVENNKETPYTIDLIQGWNQIGNPYRFDVSWNDIVSASGSPSQVEKFRVWNAGSFEDGTSLNSFSGGFVFTNAPVTITIPVTSVSGGRMADIPEPDHPLNNTNWQVTYQLTNSDLSFKFGGFGMNEEALIGKDRFDEVAMPRLPHYADINFEHPEYFIPRFNKDVVPTAEAHTWYFTVDKNSLAETTTLNWDNTYFGDNSKQLILVDQERNVPIDMRQVNSYTFNMQNTYGFKVVYGDETYVQQELILESVLLNQNYPNPFSSYTLIPFALPELYASYDVELVVLNKLGQVVKRLINRNMPPGYHEVEWNGSTNTGQKLTPGLYVYQLHVNTGEELLSYTKNIIIY